MFFIRKSMFLTSVVKRIHTYIHILYPTQLQKITRTTLCWEDGKATTAFKLQPFPKKTSCGAKAQQTPPPCCTSQHRAVSRN